MSDFDNWLTSQFDEQEIRHQIHQMDEDEYMEYT